MPSEDLTLSVITNEQRRSKGEVIEEISAEKLRKNLESFTSALSHSFKSLSRGITGAQLEEITVQISVGAEGSVKLLGSGVSTNAEGSISLTYRIDRDET